MNDPSFILPAVPDDPRQEDASAPRTSYVEQPCRSALNHVSGMGFDWSLNPYMGCAHRCAFCYVRGFEKRADRPADERYGVVIRVKTNVADVLRLELARASWKREYVVVGAATDPYQPIEGRYRLTRACIRALGDARTPFGIITRGPLVVRDLDVLRHAAGRAAVSVSFSVPTLDERVWRATEPGTSHPRHRLRALSRLVAGGIRATVALAPILPGLSDSPESLAAVVRAAREAGACGIWSAPVNLREGTREHFLAVLAREWPEELPRYEKLFAARAYLPSEFGRDLSARVRGLAIEHKIADRRTERPAPPPEPAQMELPV